MARLRSSLASPTARLAATYLTIIMVMSAGFSLVFYNASAHELGRPVPRDVFFERREADAAMPGGPANLPPASVEKFLRQRAAEGRRALARRLVLLNAGALLAGSLLSYGLARRTLRPIEEAMEAQVRFVSDASHELRTPLTAMQASNEVFLRKPHATTGEARRLAAQTIEDVTRLKSLSDSLLSLAQQGGRRQPFAAVRLHDIASQAMTQVVRQATDKDVAVEDKLENLTLRGDRDSLVQALVILLDNAVKYSHRHGTVTLASHTKGRYAYIEVRDQGIGIRASDIPYLFRRFYRADNARASGGSDVEAGGYGLGLAIARQIIANHHGAISADSTIGQGSVFTVRLPLA